MKQKKIQYINDFLTNPVLFFEGLHDYRTFRKDEFHKYTKTVYELSELKLTDTEKKEIALKVWQINYKIQSFLMHHINPNDASSIENLEEDDILEISNIIYYLANRFSYNKEIDEKYLVIGSWA